MRHNHAFLQAPIWADMVQGVEDKLFALDETEMNHHHPGSHAEPASEVRPGPGEHLLRLLTTTDLHMNLDGYDYCADRPSLPIGMTRVGPLIATARHEAQQAGGSVVLVDNGDGLQGTPMADVMAERSDQPHPLMQVFDHLGYTALGLGNHDFNFGLDTLTQILKQAPCPVVVSNLRWLGGDAPDSLCDHLTITVEPVVNGARKPLTIGLLAFVPPEILVWDSHLLQGRVEVEDMLSCAARRVPDLRAGGCDLVVVLAHAGLGVPIHGLHSDDVLKTLASIDGVDALIGGHTHKRLPGCDHADMDEVDTAKGSVRGVPTVMAGHSGAYLGQIDLILDGHGPGWRCDRFDSRLIHVAPAGQPKRPEDPKLRKLLAPAQRLVRASLAKPVGHLSHHLHDYFGSFSTDPALEMIARANASALAGMLDGTEWQSLPMLSATAPQGSSFDAGGRGFSDIPPGPVSMRHVSDLCVFPDLLNAVVVTGRQIRDWLEQTASQFHRLQPGPTPQPLLNPHIPRYEFDVIFGLSYRIDVSRATLFAPSGRPKKPQAGRIRQLRHDGKPVRDEDRFVVALSSYRANGGGNVFGLRDVAPLDLPRMMISDAVVHYLRHPGARRHPLSTKDRYPWRFTPMPDTLVTVDTGLGAMTHLHDIPDMPVRQMRIDHPGKRIELTLELPRQPLQPAQAPRI